MNSDSRTTEINLINNTTSAPQNITFEFYLPLPNDTRIYHVTYTELNSKEIARLLNNRIDLSHIPDHQLPFHYNVHHLIRQQIVQQFVGYQQNTIPQQSFDNIDIQPIFQEYSGDNAYDISPIQQLLNYQQDTIPQQSFEYSDGNAYDVSSISPNSPEDTSRYSGVQLHRDNQA
ncbi:hypothetical protein RhiirA4_461086 [Rhizophagus irregularis]|uniref:Uncharacterized protein n=1 Tax=Rhizophagus irregularis TaxID=588596 RepID=A0A2I1GI08_9GLOM|nr:hypothetical protein RhiirA4_461086 [Rhizophagus irregularis]